MKMKQSLMKAAMLFCGLGCVVNGYGQGAKYQIITNGFSSYAAAKADAEARGGYLAVIKSAAEWQQFTNNVGAAYTNGMWWLGASDALQEGTWKWITGETMTYSRWASGQPSGTGVNGKEDYLVLNPDGTWNDAAAVIQIQIGYILELPEQVSLVKAVKPAFANLSIGTIYQLQSSTDFNSWTNQGAAFTATNSSMASPQYFDVDDWDKLFFRLQVTP
jgi:hypothetical protein